MDTNARSFVANLLSPDILNSKIKKMDQVYENVKRTNPFVAKQLGNYKPSEMLGQIMTGDYQSLAASFAQGAPSMKESIMGSLPDSEAGLAVNKERGFELYKSLFGGDEDDVEEWERKHSERGEVGRAFLQETLGIGGGDSPFGELDSGLSLDSVAGAYDIMTKLYSSAPEDREGLEATFRGMGERTRATRAAQKAAERSAKKL